MKNNTNNSTGTLGNSNVQVSFWEYFNQSNISQAIVSNFIVVDCNSAIGQFLNCSTKNELIGQNILSFSATLQQNGDVISEVFKQFFCKPHAPSSAWDFQTKQKEKVETIACQSTLSGQIYHLLIQYKPAEIRLKHEINGQKYDVRSVHVDENINFCIYSRGQKKIESHEANKLLNGSINFEQCKLIFENSIDAFAIVLNEELYYSNNNFNRLFSHNPESTNGHNFFEFFPAAIHAELKTFLKNRFAEPFTWGSMEIQLPSQDENNLVFCVRACQITIAGQDNALFVFLHDKSILANKEHSQKRRDAIYKGVYEFSPFGIL